jgi:hypothetical protein
VGSSPTGPKGARNPFSTRDSGPFASPPNPLVRRLSLTLSIDTLLACPEAAAARIGPSSRWVVQVRVYAGADPVTGKDNYLSESTRDEREVQAIQTRLQALVDRQRSAATRATLSYVITEWLDVRNAGCEPVGS